VHDGPKKVKENGKLVQVLQLPSSSSLGRRQDLKTMDQITPAENANLQPLMVDEQCDGADILGQRWRWRPVD